ncbi:protein of unknown function [Streptantibioticus cattleyicolor NRRL 8057 = DSM 46488]|nr:protein of unknown function [Streptantibioticus cattleyicolor NRRL 8057 = DSM 46488]
MPQPLMQVGDGHQVDRVRVLKHVVQAFAGLRLNDRYIVEERLQLVIRYLEGTGELWTQPSLRLGLGSLPTANRGALHTEMIC